MNGIAKYPEDPSDKNIVIATIILAPALALENRQCIVNNRAIEIAISSLDKATVLRGGVSDRTEKKIASWGGKLGGIVRQT